MTVAFTGTHSQKETLEAVRMSIHQSLFKLPRVFSNLLAKLKKIGKSYCAHFDLLTVVFSLLDRLPRGEEQRAEPRRESQVVRHRREGPGREAGAAAAHQEVFPDVPTAVTTGTLRCYIYKDALKSGPQDW